MAVFVFIIESIFENHADFKMINKIHKYLLLLLLTGCSNPYESTTTKVNDFIISYPSDWQLNNDDRFVLFSSLNDSLDNTYLILNKVEGITIIEFLRKLYGTVKHDSIEQLINYQLHELTVDYQKEKIYYAEFEFENDNAEYIYMMILWGNEGEIFELGMKDLKKNRDLSYQTFQEILYSLKYKESQVFKKEFTIEFTEIRFEDLYK